MKKENIVKEKKVKEKKTIYFKRSRYRTKDFEESFLPLNRFRQFFDAIKIEWKTLLLIGFLLLLFTLPYFGVEILRWFIKSSIPSQLQAEGASEEQIISALRTAEVIYDAILIPVFMFISVGLAGFSRVLQRIVYGEGILFKHDFVDGIKLNIKYFLIMSFIYGLLRWITFFTATFAGNANLLSSAIKGVVMGVFYGVFVPIILFMFAQTVVYKMNFITMFKNGYRLAFAKIFGCWGFSFTLFAVFFLSYIPSPFIRIGVEIGLIVFLAPLYLLAFLLFTVSTFDKYINETYYPEIYRKGLRPSIFKEIEK